MKKFFLVFIITPRKIINNFKKGYKIGCPERGLGIIETMCGLIVHFDLVGQKSHQKSNSKLEECQLNLLGWG